MKIHYIAAFMAEFPSDRANSIHVMRMCQAFTSLGHEVVLYVRENKSAVDEIFQFYGMSSSFKIVRLSSVVPKVNRLWHCVKAVAAAKRSGCDVVVSRSAIASALAAIAKMKVVFDAHGPIWQRNFLEILGYRFLRSSDYLYNMTCNSYALKRMYEERKLAPKVGIMVAHNGAVRSDPAIDVCLQGRRNALHVGYTGHLYSGRGIEVICALASTLDDVEFHIVGGAASDVEYWKSRAPHKNVHFYGFVNPSHVSSYLAKFDVLLAPYQARGVSVAGGAGDTSRFMNPIKIMEYMVSGRAIVASDLPAIREILPEGAALYAKPDDVDEWATCIEKLRDDRLRAQMGTAALIASKQISWESRARKMIRQQVSVPSERNNSATAPGAADRI